MYLFKRNIDLQNFLKSENKEQKPIGFIPTMGALHAGHLSLIERCREDGGLSVCSIFVNPTQFNDPGDYANYPITIDADIELLVKHGCDVLFLPDLKEIYPDEGIDTPALDLEGLDKPMEGAYRAGHFEGVVQVVNRLLDIVSPDLLYMGQKDYQQWCIIRKMLEQVHREVELRMCPVFREPDGLAMSSRNVRLTPEERARAPLIYQTLTQAAKMVQSSSLADIKNWAAAQLQLPGFSLEYFEFANAHTLEEVNSIEEAENIVLCIAIWLGKVRLIDTIFIKGSSQ